MVITTRGYIFIALNAIRALSIVSLILVFSSEIVGMVNDIKAVDAFMDLGGSGNSTLNTLDYGYIEDSTVPNQAAGPFWAVVNRLLILFQVIALILAEAEWPTVFFMRYFPVLGPDFGLGALGIFQGLIGAAILSHHVDEFSLVSAFFLFSLGCVNMLLGLIFRQSAKERRALSAWKSQSGRVLPMHNPRTAASPSFLSSTYSGNDEKTDEFGGYRGSKPGYGFGRQGEKQAGLRGFVLQRPVETLPRYAPRPVSITSSGSSTKQGTDESGKGAKKSHHSRESSASSESDVESETEHEEEEESHEQHARQAVPTFSSSHTAI